MKRVRAAAAIPAVLSILVLAGACSVPPGPTGGPGADRPPSAGLLVAGGESVAGQLGSYVWRDGGADSPWLPGAPATIEADQVLEFALSTDAPLAAWQARYGPADADGPEGAQPLANAGLDGILIESPPRGRWTLELALIFGEGLGEARYFWQLEVR